MSATHKNIVATIGEYEKDGKTKKFYLTIGRIVTKDDGKEFIKIDCIPTNWNGFAGVYAPKSKSDNLDAIPDNGQRDDDLPF